MCSWARRPHPIGPLPTSQVLRQVVVFSRTSRVCFPSLGLPTAQVTTSATGIHTRGLHTLWSPESSAAPAPRRGPGTQPGWAQGASLPPDRAPKPRLQLGRGLACAVNAHRREQGLHARVRVCARVCEGPARPIQSDFRKLSRGSHFPPRCSRLDPRRGWLLPALRRPSPASISPCLLRLSLRLPPALCLSASAALSVPVSVCGCLPVCLSLATPVSPVTFFKPEDVGFLL